ncbi:SPFH domain-containing protein [Niabella drilacis]|uniref:Membrane protease subunit, stomatin/prohibitin family, contains C-terminal Zn-ribbon domain n=1 Tax=Niabella drilacis (strain DSM 25811 / CCM 8410 / CCUG 62505 / LMG 26954 / E90) TaxID=1285928 RepID=A0A1G6LYT9_NIADE|nr:SPFH domain-containing protein [Niabella drilacis]SDC48277.1 Membrane protease subunit, stomatin/prohibitin family, contains C-terminal Zn-ribbon domain [Niabella drilacis]
MSLPFIEIIESPTPDPNLLMWKFADTDKEIKNGAKLTVRESQQALLLNEGQLADIFLPGMHTLSTENIPIISRLKGWKYGFESPFKADVYFFNTYHFINNKWGTPAPILMSDPQFGQVRIRAFGSFDIKIADPGTFFRTYAGTFPRLTIFELQSQLRDFVAPKFGEVLANEQIPVTAVAGNITELSKKIEPHLKPYFATLGLELTQFVITSVTLPEEVTAFYDKVTNMNMVTDMDKFTKFNTANAIGDKGTALNDATQTGMAMGLMMNQLQQNNSTIAAPASATPQEDITAKLQKLKTLFENGLIDEEEYKTKKAELLTLL